MWKDITTLCERYYRELERFLLRRVHSPDIAADMCLLKLPPSNCGGWFSFEQRAAASSLVTAPEPTVDGASEGLCRHG